MFFLWNSNFHKEEAWFLVILYFLAQKCHLLKEYFLQEMSFFVRNIFLWLNCHFFLRNIRFLERRGMVFSSILFFVQMSYYLLCVFFVLSFMQKFHFFGWIAIFQKEVTWFLVVLSFITQMCHFIYQKILFCHVVPLLATSVIFCQKCIFFMKE